MRGRSIPGITDGSEVGLSEIGVGEDRLRVIESLMKSLSESTNGGVLLFEELRMKASSSTLDGTFDLFVLGRWLEAQEVIEISLEKPDQRFGIIEDHGVDVRGRRHERFRGIRALSAK